MVHQIMTYLLRLNTLEKKIDNINQQLVDILILLNDNKKDCEKMSSHIDFIDSVYDKLKMPIDFVCSRVNMITNSESMFNKH